MSERAYIFSYMDEAHLEGVHFIVEENAALGIAVATLHVEKLEVRLLACRCVSSRLV